MFFNWRINILSDNFLENISYAKIRLTMLILVIIVLLGFAFAIFATQNTNVITLYFGNFVLGNIPLYLSILVPFLLGIILATILHIAKDLSQRLTISEQKDKLKKNTADIAELTKKAHKLELENVKLKKNTDKEFDEESF